MSALAPARNLSTSRDLDAQRASLCAIVRHVKRVEFAGVALEFDWKKKWILNAQRRHQI
jgi:hypothetical protein